MSVYNNLQGVIIPKGFLLYRAANTAEEYPQPRLCSDTDKFGTYFCVMNPVIAELMTLEKKKSLIVTCYKTTKDITVSFGKYSYRELHDHDFEIMDMADSLEKYNIYNVSHYDNELVYPICEFDTFWNKYLVAEIFLNPFDIKSVKKIFHYRMSLAFAKCKYNKHGYVKRKSTKRKMSRHQYARRRYANFFK